MYCIHFLGSRKLMVVLRLMCARGTLRSLTTMGGRLLDAVGGSRATSFNQMEAEACKSSAVRLFPDSSSSKSLKMDRYRLLIIPMSAYSSQKARLFGK